MKKITKDRYPEKTSINLVMKEQDGGNWKVQVAIFAVFLVLLGIFVKIEVVGRLNRVMEASAEYGDVQSQIADLQKYNEDYEKVEEQYSHYSSNYLTEEEKALQDRLQIFEMMEAYVMPHAQIQSLDISENTVTVMIARTDLNVVSSIVAMLEGDERTSYVSVSTAQTGEDKKNKTVNANLVIQLKPGGETDNAES